ncbi:hypothetical protein AVEN_200706-1 [Araneus ventricosus]|uniref:Uncharacterized protein n=1 Tax=Araneus ventricosus TaxID=182803 RepID=A0A4Y2IL75_ARAVE|nr:hypothetical protein AVEN_200706-1 [Araneus ventricosus]
MHVCSSVLHAYRKVKKKSRVRLSKWISSRKVADRTMYCQLEWQIFGFFDEMNGLSRCASSTDPFAGNKVTRLHLRHLFTNDSIRRLLAKCIRTKTGNTSSSSPYALLVPAEWLKNRSFACASE